MKNLLLVSMLSVFTISCASIKKGTIIAKQAGQYSNNHKYLETVSKIERSIESQINVNNMAFNQSQSVPSLKPPMRRGFYKLNEEVVRVNTTLQPNTPYNRIVLSNSEVMLIAKNHIYNIKDKTKYRQVTVRSYSGLLPRGRVSKNKIDVTIAGIGVNYKDYKDLDQLLKEAPIDETAQWTLVKRINPKKAKAVVTKIKAKLEVAQ